VIELAILGILKEADLHGYELKKHLRKVLGPLSNVSFGSLYPALKRLEGKGAVAVVVIDDGPERSSMPMTGSLAGEVAAFRARHRVTRDPRNKKVYGITAVGHARLSELMADPADDERSFGMKLAFFRWCDRPTRLNLLERRRTTLCQRLEETRRAISSREGDDPYVRSLMEHDTESTMRDIDWIGRLIASEEEQAASDGRDKEPTGGHP
jgi:DNA-binding PadR family transcriptional regulator